MTDPTIICPKCKAEIKLTDAMAAPMIASIRSEAVDTIRTARYRIAADEKKKAEAKMDDELGGVKAELFDMHADLSRKNQELVGARQEQVKAIKLQTTLEDTKRDMNLTIENRVNSAVAIASRAIRDTTKAEAEQGMKLKVTEKEEQLAGMTRQIDELKRRAEQGSQQAQGEALELELEASLKAKFPHDSVTPVLKGEIGADIVQLVITPQAEQVGLIIWELKRTKAWSQGWLAKLREDQRRVTANIAVLVTQTMPEGVGLFDFIDGIWVVSIEAALPVAAMLRQALFELQSVKLSQTGQQTKQEMIYAYLTGTQFRQRVQAIVEAFTTMQIDLNTEKKAITKQWAKREIQIEHVMSSTVGMYGDLQGIAGKTLKEIQGLVVDGE